MVSNVHLVKSAFYHMQPIYLFHWHIESYANCFKRKRHHNSWTQFWNYAHSDMHVGAAAAARNSCFCELAYTIGWNHFWSCISQFYASGNSPEINFVILTLSYISHWITNICTYVLWTGLNLRLHACLDRGADGGRILGLLKIYELYILKVS